ncbi:MAG: hypothetical protein K2H53_05770 [Clostridia bacterium]|nr:hypothetical protein [Clostridia bacterium]
MRPSKGFGIASLVISILSLVCFRYIFISVTLALVASVLGLIGRKKGDTTFAVAGLTIGIISLLITFVLFVVLNLLDTVLFYVPDWYK